MDVMNLSERYNGCFAYNYYSGDSKDVLPEKFIIFLYFYNYFRNWESFGSNLDIKQLWDYYLSHWERIKNQFSLLSFNPTKVTF